MLEVFMLMSFNLNPLNAFPRPFDQLERTRNAARFAADLTGPVNRPKWAGAIHHTHKKINKYFHQKVNCSVKVFAHSQAEIQEMPLL